MARFLSSGHFAVKKIAVGESHSYLLQTLREVLFRPLPVQHQSFIHPNVWKLGPLAGTTTPPQHHHVPSCMARGLPVLGLRTIRANVTVRFLPFKS
jgi:hypothetical protein